VAVVKDGEDDFGQCAAVKSKREWFK